MAEDRLLTRPFLLCFWSNMFQGLAFNLFLHFPAYLHDLGANDVEIGLVSSLTAVAAIAIRQPIGRAMDRRGRRPVILAGGILNVLVLALYLTLTELGPWLYVVRVLHGFAEALLFTSLFTYAADHVPIRSRTQGLALFGVSGMLPIALAGFLGDWLIRAAGWPLVFQVATGFAVLSLLLSLRMPEVQRAGDGDAPTGMRAVLRQRDLRPLWWIGAVFTVALTSIFVFAHRYVDETGVGSMGGFFGAYTAAALLLRVGFGWLPDRVGPKRVLGPALVALAGGFLVLAGARTGVDVALAGVLCGLGHGYTFPILFGLVVSRAPEANRGMAMAVYTGLFDLGVLLGGPVFGWWIEASGFAAMYVVAAVSVLAGSAVFFVWDARVARSSR